METIEFLVSYITPYIAVIVLIPVLLYLRGRWSRHERRGPRRDRDKERAKRDKLERK